MRQVRSYVRSGTLLGMSSIQMAIFPSDNGAILTNTFIERLSSFWVVPSCHFDHRCNSMNFGLLSQPEQLLYRGDVRVKKIM